MLEVVTLLEFLSLSSSVLLTAKGEEEASIAGIGRGIKRTGVTVGIVGMVVGKVGIVVGGGKIGRGVVCGHRGVTGGM